MRKIILWTFILSLAQDKALAHTIVTFKLINGAFQYSSEELSGNSTNMGSPSIGFLKPLDEKHYLGGSFDVFFNTTSQAVSLYGVSLIYKYSLKGQGASFSTEVPDISLNTSTKWEYYFLSTFKRYTYFLGSNKTTETRFDQNGDFFNFDLGLGSSYDIGHHFRATADISKTIFSFASSDNRVKFKSLLLSVGIQKEF